jgi:branched-chain amino acid transport system substrate-binding protein
MRNKMAKGKRVGIAIMAVALAALLLVTACAPSTPSAPTKQVQIGALFPLTGGGGPSMQPAFQAFMDYVRYFNEAESDHGFAVEALWRDTMTQRPPFLSGWSAFIGEGVPLIVIASPLDLQAIWNRVERDQTPIVQVALDSPPQIEPPGWVFASMCPPGEQLSVVLDYYMENWKEERPPKLGFFAYTGSYGREAVIDAAPYAESIGYEVIPTTEIIELIVLDATTQLVRLQDAGADLIFMQTTSMGIGPILNDAKRLGLIGKIQFATTTEGLGDPVLGLAGDATNGLMCYDPYPWFDETQIPGVRTFEDKQVEYHGKVVEDVGLMQGWTYGAIACEAARLAVEQVGYENIDGPAMRRALESLDLDLGGMIRITYGPENRRGCRIYAVYEMQDGKRVRVSDWLEAPILSR